MALTISINQAAAFTVNVGVPGPTGATGPQGPAGPPGPAGGGSVWGNITGTLSNQTDLASALAGKYPTTNPAGYIDLTTAGLYFYPLTGNPGGFATQAWVIGQNYLTIGSLDAYATMSWVNTELAGYALQSWVTDHAYPLTGNPSGFLTSASLSGYATESWVTSQGYITSSALAPYLSFDGGSMNANAEIYFEDTVQGRVSLASGSAFAVSSSSNPDLVSNLLYDRVFVKNATSKTSIIPTGVEFPDLTFQTTAGLSPATAASTYQTLAGMSSYLTTSAAAATYAVIARGLPASGTVGQVLTKVNGTDYNATWTTIIPGDRYLTTSTSAMSISNGAKTFTAGTGLSYTPTQDVTIAHDSANHMHGTVTSYNSGTGAMVVDVQNHSGSGTYTSWTINVGGAIPAASVIWGDITGTLGDQSDLATALNAKLETSTAASTYQTISGMSSYLTTSDAATTYAPLSKAVPAGGTTGQVLTKASDIDWSLVWAAGGGGGGIPDAPSDNYVYGRINGFWYRLPGFSPFTNVATNVSSIASWSFAGANIYLSTSGGVSVDTASSVYQIAISGGDTSSTVIDLSAMSAVTGQVAFYNLSQMTTTPILPSSSFNNLSIDTCVFSTMPTLNTLTNLQFLQVQNCPNITSIPELPPNLNNNFSVYNCPITAIPSIGIVSNVQISSTAITSGPDCGANSTLVLATFSFNNSMTTAPNFSSATALASATVNNNNLMATAPSFEYCSSLTQIQVSGNPLMTSPPNLNGCDVAQNISIVNNATLSASPSLSFSANLGVLDLYNNPMLSTIPGIGGFPALYRIDLNGCGVTDLSSLDSLGNSAAGNASSYGIYGGYFNVSGGTNAAFDSMNLPGWISTLQSYSWTVIYNSY